MGKVMNKKVGKCRKFDEETDDVWVKGKLTSSYRLSYIYMAIYAAIRLYKTINDE